VTAFAWRRPEWWSLALCAAAWVLMMRGHSHHADHGISGWMLMTFAMMLPMVLDSVRATAERSLWRRRHRAIAAFLIGYLSLWVVIGAFVTLVRIPSSRQQWFAAGAFTIAGLWQLTRAKRIALAGCHRTTPLAPSGWQADRDCIRYGWMIGARCIVSCWALMLACFVAGHAIVATAGLTAIGTVERYTSRPDQRLLSAALFAGALVYLAG
jgi:predicted metal-binding membrane protein